MVAVHVAIQKINPSHKVLFFALPVHNFRKLGWEISNPFSLGEKSMCFGQIDLLLLFATLTFARIIFLMP